MKKYEIILTTERKCRKCGNIYKTEEELNSREFDLQYNVINASLDPSILHCKKCDQDTVQDIVSVNHKPKEA